MKEDWCCTIFPYHCMENSEMLGLIPYSHTSIQFLVVQQEISGKILLKVESRAYPSGAITVCQSIACCVSKEEA